MPAQEHNYAFYFFHNTYFNLEYLEELIFKFKLYKLLDKLDMLLY